MRCGAPGAATCPQGLSCSAGFCRAEGASGSCPGGADGGGDAIDAGPCLAVDLESGGHTDTAWFVDRVALAGGAFQGSYDAPVLDGGEPRAWGSLEWTPAYPSLRPLPVARAVETGYPMGNADMSASVLLLPLDARSGMSLEDASGLAHHAACLPGECPSVGAPSLFTRALEFTSAARRVSAPTASDLEPATFTVESWVQVVGLPVGSAGGIVGKGVNPTEPYAAYALEHSQAAGQIDRFRCYATLGGIGLTVVGSSTHAPGITEWNHVACSYDGAALRLYVNGAQENMLPASGAVGYGQMDPALYLGAFGGGSQYLVGLVDEVAVHSRALDAGEIRDHWRRGALRVQLQVRSCDDPLCDGETFVGPSGEDTTYYSEACLDVPPTGTTVAPATFSLNNADCDGDGAEDDGPGLAVPPGRYLQVRVRLATTSAVESPAVLSASACE